MAEDWEPKSRQNLGVGQKIQCKAILGNGNRCRQYAMLGQMICKNHGGMNRTTKAKAQERIILQDAEKALERLKSEKRKSARANSILEIMPITDPLTALYNVAGELMALKELLRGKVEDMRGEIETSPGSSEVRGAFTAYQIVLRDVVNTLSKITQLKIDERLVAIEQQKADMIASAIVLTLAELNLDRETQDKAKVAVVQRLRIAASA